jgi:hypothetical protein
VIEWRFSIKRKLALALLLAGLPTFADMISTTTGPYPLSGTITPMTLPSLPQTTAFSTADYSVAFTPDGGVAKGSASGLYAAPWDYATGQLWSGTYLTTDTGSVKPN